MFAVNNNDIIEEMKRLRNMPWAYLYRKPTARPKGRAGWVY